MRFTGGHTRASPPVFLFRSQNPHLLHTYWNLRCFLLDRIHFFLWLSESTDWGTKHLYATDARIISPEQGYMWKSSQKIKKSETKITHTIKALFFTKPTLISFGPWTRVSLSSDSNLLIMTPHSLISVNLFWSSLTVPATIYFPKPGLTYFFTLSQYDPKFLTEPCHPGLPHPHKFISPSGALLTPPAIKLYPLNRCCNPWPRKSKPVTPR